VSRISLWDGRTLALEDRGMASGRPVLFLHAAPGSRLLDPDPWTTAGSRVRLLTYDRPGYGASTPLSPDKVPTILGHAEDAAAVIEYLGIGPVPVVGWSAGGLVALALAEARPELVRRVVMVATPAHQDEVGHLPDEHLDMIEALRPDLPSAAARVAEALSPIARDAQAMLSLIGSGPADDAVHKDPVFGPRLHTMASEAVRQGAGGLAADIVASTIAPWDFDPAAVSVPVELWYGEQDELVPPEHGAWWAGVLSDCNLHVVPDAGHLLPIARWKPILASAA
jgi:pimeloyl-ACP methyl ester carboxylesterase